MLGAAANSDYHSANDGQYPANRPVKRPRDDPALYPSPGSAFIGPPVVAESSRNVRQEMIPTPRTQEKDRNRKLSCKECRRLKLKCDRVFPCQSCVKRGCGSLCPEGALTSGRGSRFILANTEQLHEKITQLSDRVRQLEDALQALQSTCSNQPHPLLSPELLRVKTSQDLYSTRQPPLAGPSGIDRGETSYATAELDHRPIGEEPALPEVPEDILQLSATFPFPWSVDLRIRKRIRDSLPPRHEAQAICEEAQKNALWQYHLDSDETFLQNLLHHCYSTRIEDLSPRRLALLLMYLSIGSIVDLNRPIGSLHGEAYHHLARAAVCEIPLMEEPDFDVLHALFFMIWWHLIFSDNKKAVGYAWNLMGFVAKLAQGLGLHRDSPRLKGIPEEDEKRRAIFWELMNLDCRMSLSLGRPPSICLSHVDTKTPSFHGSGLYLPKEEVIYHEWKHAFFVQCLTPVLNATVAIETPDYFKILELDKTLRDFSVPTLLSEQYTLEAHPRFLVMQRALVSSSRDIALLQLHRRLFTEAINSAETFGLDHKYAPSVLATYLGATSLISTIETLFNYEPELSARFLYFWFNSYSAAVTLSLFVFRASSTSLVLNASQEIDRICRLFRRAAKILPVSGRILPLLEKLARKAHSCLQQHQIPSAVDETRYPIQHLAQYSAPLGNKFSISVQDAHPSLVKFAEEITSTVPVHPSTSPSATANYHPYQSVVPPPSGAWADHRPGSWLPDIYRYSSAGVGLEERYICPPPPPQPTPFTPSSPRVDNKEEFNFDYGAIIAQPAQLDETSYMAWF